MDNAVFIILLILIFGPGLGGIATAIYSTRAKRRRMELLHLERMAALEKGVPLPELPPLDDVPPVPRPRGDRRVQVPLLLGVIFLCAGTGAMIALLMTWSLSQYWTLPLPLSAGPPPLSRPGGRKSRSPSSRNRGPATAQATSERRPAQGRSAHKPRPRRRSSWRAGAVGVPPLERIRL